MTNRALKIRAGLDAVAALDKDLRQFELGDADWGIIEEVNSFLKPFAE